MDKSGPSLLFVPTEATSQLLTKSKPTHTQKSRHYFTPLLHHSITPLLLRLILLRSEGAADQSLHCGGWGSALVED
jgi:hypothetical protein